MSIVDISQLYANAIHAPIINGYPKCKHFIAAWIKAVALLRHVPIGLVARELHQKYDSIPGMPRRISEALQMVAHGQVKNDPLHQYDAIVESQNGNGHYPVSLKTHSCECMDWKTSHATL